MSHQQYVQWHDDLMMEHRYWYGYLADCDKKENIVEKLESYYVNHRAGYIGKIRDISGLDYNAQTHIIDHIAFMLQERAKARKKQRQVGRRVIFRTLLRDPTAKRAETKRFRYGKTERRGRIYIYKQDRKTGRFTKFSKQERKEVETWRQKKT